MSDQKALVEAGIMTEDGQAVLSKVRRSADNLRDVDRASEGFIQLRDNIANVGVLNPPAVTVRHDDDGSPYLLLIDGNHRFCAMVDLGWTEGPVYIITAEEGDELYRQIMANTHKVETKPAEFAGAVEKILTLNPGVTKAEFAASMQKSTAWLEGILKLRKLSPQLKELVDDGRIKLANAITISSLPEEEQPAFIERAMTMGSIEFKEDVKNRALEITKARREGRKADEEAFQAKEILRKISEIKEEMNNLEHWQRLLNALDELPSPQEAFALGIAFTIKMDPVSQADQEQAWDDRKNKQKERKERAKAERQSRKSFEASRAADRTELELSLYRDSVDEATIKTRLDEFDKETEVLVESAVADALKDEQTVETTA